MKHPTKRPGRSPVGIIRSSFRQDGKVKHSTHGRLVGLSLNQLKLVQAAFRSDVLPKGSQNCATGSAPSLPQNRWSHPQPCVPLHLGLLPAMARQ